MILKINYKDKSKTFYNDFQANRFIGAYHPEMVYEQIRPGLYYRFNKHEFWDDYTEMTGEEWAMVAKELLSNFT